MNSFPTCQVCQKHFSLKGPAPFLLPCLHAVCETCVTSAAGGVISCSLCDIDVNLTGTRLQRDVVREKEIFHLSVQNHPELVLCTHEEDGNQAVCWCQECDEFLCEHCQMVHNSFKGTKIHTVQDIGELELGDLVKDKYCTVHPKFMIDTWDKDCSILTCGKCRLGDHAGHEIVDVEVAAEITRKEIANFGREIHSFYEQHRVHLLATEENLQSSHDRDSILNRKISLVFNTLKSLLDQREKELMIELVTQESNARDQLNAKKKTSETCHQRCLTTSDYINKTLQYSSLYDILELKQLLKEKLQRCKKSAPSEEYKPLPLPVFNTVGLEGITFTLAHFGTIATDDTVFTDRNKDSATQTEEDVMQELERVTKEFKQFQSCCQEIFTGKKDDAQKESLDQEEALKQKIKQLKTCQERLNRKEQEIERFSGFYRLRTPAFEESFLLTCLHTKFSKTKFNSDEVRINTRDELINKSQPNPPHSHQRLIKYYGTSSTLPLLQCGSPQYFEVKSRVGIKKPLQETNLLLEIGLVRVEEQDQHYSINRHLQSYSLDVAHCTTHSSICRNVWRHGNHLTCLPDTLENTPGSSASLHYGLVYDSARSRISFLDLKKESIVEKIDNVDSSVALWPMFGVYNPGRANVGMSLVVGCDIDMTEKKKALILESLS